LKEKKSIASIVWLEDELSERIGRLAGTSMARRSVKKSEWLFMHMIVVNGMIEVNKVRKPRVDRKSQSCAYRNVDLLSGRTGAASVHLISDYEPDGTKPPSRLLWTK
jgi:hypothetical protein